jgi:hypothetical protein
MTLYMPNQGIYILFFPMSLTLTQVTCLHQGHPYVVDGVIGFVSHNHIHLNPLGPSGYGNPYG